MSENLEIGHVSPFLKASDVGRQAEMLSQHHCRYGESFASRCLQAGHANWNEQRLSKCGRRVFRFQWLLMTQKDNTDKRECNAISGLILLFRPKGKAEFFVWGGGIIILFRF